MPNKNEKTKDLSIDPSEKINYTIKTMDSDLKNKGFSASSFNLSKTKKAPEDKARKNIQPKKEEPAQKENPNPFLKNLVPTTKNIPPKFPPEKNKTEKNEPKSIKKIPPKPISPILEKNSEKSSSVNNKLLVVLFIISLTAVCAGVYYFYSNQKTSSTPPIAEDNSSPELVNPEVSIEKKVPLPEKLANSKILNLETETDLNSSLLEKRTSLLKNTENYYEIKKDGVTLTSSELLTLLKIQFPKEILSKLKNGWISLYFQKNILKMGLVLKIQEDSTETRSFLENNEYRLPELLKPLFIDESFVLQDEPIIFKESGVIKNIRYYNFVANSSDKSIDWGITNDNYLVLSTSKESALQLIKDLETD